MDDAHFLRRQLIITGFAVPVGYALLSFPWTLLALIYLTAKPLYGLGALLVLIGYAVLGGLAWHRKHFLWTALFLLISSVPLLWHFVAVPEMQERHFRNCNAIPPEARIVYYRESGGPDVTRFCIVQHPSNHPRPIDSSPGYRPFVPGALAIMQNVQRELDIPSSRMPDTNKRTLTYHGGENETTVHSWMQMTVYDSATAQEWYFEDGR